MIIQKSFDKGNKLGILYLIGTPIGNLGDMTYRAVQILTEVDIVAAEDTRQTIKLLNHFKLKKPLISYHEHNKKTSGKELIGKLLAGLSIALVSDAGMPAISDPGYELVKEAIDNSINVIPVPGANAAITGLIASGLPTKSFIFIGFLPRQKKELIQELERCKAYEETLICYEAPHRISKTLLTMSEVFGNRRIVVVRELTKKFEEFLRGSIEELVSYFNDNSIKGELTIIIEGAKTGEINNDEWWQFLSVHDHVDYYIEKGLSVKDAVKNTAIDRSVQKRNIYQEYHNL